MTRTKDEIRVERVLDAPREEVFRAWTDPELLMRWWGPENCSTPYAEVDLRPGGKYLFVMHPESGDPMRLAGTYCEVDAPQRLVYTWRWESGVPDPTESVVTVEFHELGDQTRIILTHGGFDEGSDLEPYRAGWKSGLDKLDALITAA